ncbi:cation transporter [bacterium]|nr:cation transporter [bacterium]
MKNIQTDKTGNSFKEGIKITLIGVVVNLLLVSAKLLMGIFGHSYALIADAMHSLSDIVTDFGLLIGLNIAGKPHDKNHLYGHGKIDNYIAHVLGVFIIFAGFSLAYYSLKIIINSTEFISPCSFAIIVALISVVSKEILFRVTMKVGKKIGSTSTQANAWHHRSDAISSFAALIGITIAVIIPRFAVLDKIISIIIAAFVVKVGINITVRSFKYLIDTAPPPEMLEDAGSIARKVDGVIDVHELRARYYADSLFFDLHITVAPDISVKDGHNIAKQVEYSLLNRIKGVIDVTIHVDPI